MEGRRDHIGATAVYFGPEADVKVDTTGFRDFGPPVRSDRLAGDPPDNLADQVAEGNGVVAVLCSGLPPWFVANQGRG